MCVLKVSTCACVRACVRVCVCVYVCVCVGVGVSMYDCQREYPRIHVCIMSLSTPRNNAHLCRLQGEFLLHRYHFLTLHSIGPPPPPASPRQCDSGQALFLLNSRAPVRLNGLQSTGNHYVATCFQRQRRRDKSTVAIIHSRSCGAVCSQAWRRTV